MIQCLRNATWRLQAVKGHFPQFDEWYEPWQNRMRDEPRLSWLNDARIEITKRTGLISESYAAVSVIDSYLHAPVTIFQFPVELSTSELVELAVESLPLENREYKTIEIRRRWISPDFPDEELLMILSKCLVFLRDIVTDAMRELLHLRESVWDFDSALEVDPSEIPRLVLADSLSEVERVEYSMKRDVSRHDLEERYGVNYDTLKKPSDLVSKAKFYHDQARMVFMVDGFHVGMFIMTRGEGEGEIMMFAPEDKRDKFLFARQVADKVLEKRYDMVVLQSESWLAALPENPSEYVEVSEIVDRREVLGTWLESSDGTRIAYMSGILRDGDTISLADAIELKAPSTLFEPIRRSWRMF